MFLSKSECDTRHTVQRTVVKDTGSVLDYTGGLKLDPPWNSFTNAELWLHKSVGPPNITTVIFKYITGHRRTYDFLLRNLLCSFCSSTTLNINC